MVAFALAFSWVYRATEYKYHPGQESGVVPLGHGGYQGGLLGIRAYGQAMNVLDLVGGMGEAFSMFMSKRRGGNDVRAYEGGNPGSNGYRLDGYEADGFAGEGAPVAGKDWREEVQQQQLREPRRGLRHGRRHRGEY